MATNAWVDWKQLPLDIKRKITKEALSGPGSFGANVQEVSHGFAYDRMRQQHRVHTGESFHPSAYPRNSRMSHTERLKYAAYGVAGLVGAMGTDALTPNWLKSRGVTNEHSGTAKSQSLEPSS